MKKGKAFLSVWILLGILCGGTPSPGLSDERILEGAKSEGKLVFYTGIFDSEARAFLAAFEKKYPFIKTSFYRGAGGPALVARIQSEQRAGAHLWDVYNSAGLEGFVLWEQGYFGKYDSPERKHYPEGFKDAEGYWTTMYTTPFVASYNTRMASPSELPKNYFDLLDPKWKGRLGLDSRDIEWYANLKKIWGMEKTRSFFSGLVKQNVSLRSGRALLTELLAAGEFSILINNYAYIGVRAKRKGSPVENLPLDPVITGAGPIAINRFSPHPNAARLFMDFSLSAEGQEILIKQGRSSARLDVKMNPLSEIKKVKGVKVVASDLSLGKVYAEARKEYEDLLGITRK